MAPIIVEAILSQVRGMYLLDTQAKTLINIQILMICGATVSMLTEAFCR